MESRAGSIFQIGILIETFYISFYFILEFYAWTFDNLHINNLFGESEKVEGIKIHNSLIISVESWNMWTYNMRFSLIKGIK